MRGERAKAGAAISVTGHTVPVHDGGVALSLAGCNDGINPAFRRRAAAMRAWDVALLARLGHCVARAF